MKNILFISILASLVFASCSRDEDNFTPFDNIDGSAIGFTNPIAGDITEDLTLTSDKVYTLVGALAVKEGATLTIEPGTRIEAVAGANNTYVVIEPGAKIMAEGTADAPIVFTSIADNPRSGDWGGLLLVGEAPISGGGTSTTEVLPLQYGGTNAEDNSGVLDYVVVEYTGSRIGGEAEFNGFTFYGVGSGTSVSNIAALYGDDDAIEFFGGTVSVENVLVANPRDDMFDWTQGWNGSGTNIYGILTEDLLSTSDDPRGIEGDGNLDGRSPADAGQSNPTISNITIINNSSFAMSDLIKVRRGSGATITGAYLAVGENGSASDLIDLSDSRGDALATTSITGTASSDNDLDITDINNAPSASVTITEGSEPSVDSSIFDWTGFEF